LGLWKKDDLARVTVYLRRVISFLQKPAMMKSLEIPPVLVSAMGYCGRLKS